MHKLFKGLRSDKKTFYNMKYEEFAPLIKTKY